MKVEYHQQWQRAQLLILLKCGFSGTNHSKTLCISIILFRLVMQYLNHRYNDIMKCILTGITISWYINVIHYVASYGHQSIISHHSAAEQATTNFLHSLRSWAKEAIASGFKSQSSFIYLQLPLSTKF